MSAPVDSDDVVVGFIETQHITAEGKNHYRCTWNIEKISTYGSKLLRSPMFVVSNRDEFKWCLKIQSFNISSNNRYDYILRLVLDPTSDGEAARAKIKLFVANYNQPHRECNLDSSITYKFTKKSENNPCIASYFYLEDLEDLFETVDDDYYSLSIVCDIMIESTISDELSLSKDLQLLLSNQLLTDVVLSVGGKNYPLHKTILAARSSVLAAMFTHEMEENRNSVVYIEDIGEKVVEEMLRYIYTGKVEKLNAGAQDLFIAADKYDLKGLRTRCEEIMIENLSSSNAFDLLLFADSYNANELKSEAINFIAVTSTRLKKTSTWETILSNPQLHREISEAVFNPKFASTELIE